MRNARLCSTAATVVGAVSICFLVGCVTSQERQREMLSREEFRILYPRQYYDSLDPLERRAIERRLMEEEWSERKR